MRFGSEAERDRALGEMSGHFISNRPIRVSLATAKKSSNLQVQCACRAAVRQCVCVLGHVPGTVGSTVHAAVHDNLDLTYTSDAFCSMGRGWARAAGARACRGLSEIWTPPTPRSSLEGSAQR